jgi:hypothetical protein
MADVDGDSQKHNVAKGEIRLPLTSLTSLDSEILYMSKDIVKKVYPIARELVAEPHKSLQQPHAIVQPAVALL